MFHQRHGDGDVFEAVDDEIDFVIEESLLELADEEAFAADLVEGSVGDLVTGGFESGDSDVQIWVEMLKRAYDEVGLGEREGGAAGAEAEGLV